jgi:hypothetical protein
MDRKQESEEYKGSGWPFFWGTGGSILSAREAEREATRMAPFSSVAALAAVFCPAVGNVFALAQASAGCTSSSFTTPSWLVENFASQTSGNLTVTSFHALNRATNTSLELRCQTSPSNATAGWQSCSSGNKTASNLPLVASFQADQSTAWFLFNETWNCSDLPPVEP